MASNPFSAHDLKPARGLIIEGEPVIAADIQHVLARAGYGVTGIAATAAEAVREFERSEPDFITAEIQLVDGSSGIDAVRSIQNVADIPAIFVTAFPERLLLAERPHPLFLLTKPFMHESLVAAVDQMLLKKGIRQPPSAGIRAINDAVSAAIIALNRVPAANDNSTLVLAGHNNPPADSALSEGDYKAVSEALHDLLALSGQGEFSAAMADKALSTLSSASEKISAWAVDIVKQVEEGFFNQIGASLADWKFLVSAWLILSGKLDAVVVAVQAFLTR